jgi:hypothetical protein
MVAKAAWLSVEPRVCLAEYLASDEPKILSSSMNWAANSGQPDEEEELRYSGDDSLEFE